MTRPWRSFTEGRAAPSEGAEGWSALTTVRHTTHLVPAIRIAEARALVARLIYNGVLRETRTKVVYFSPNYWAEGSRYGTFEFAVAWSELLKGRDMYWVDEIRDYKYPIYRFLLTSRDVSALPVERYDPALDDGPIRRIGDDWFWATGYAAEIVIDEDLSLDAVTSLEFGRHHDRLCSVGSADCTERGHGGSEDAIKSFIGVLLGRGLHSLDRLLKDGGRPTDECHRALAKAWPILMRSTAFGGPVARPDEAANMVRAALLTIQTGDRGRVKQLMGMIADEVVAEQAYLDVIREHFDDPGFVWRD